jgi:hypothetical protein
MNAFSNLRIVQNVEKWQFEGVQTRLKHAKFGALIVTVQVPAARSPPPPPSIAVTYSSVA